MHLDLTWLNFNLFLSCPQLASGEVYGKDQPIALQLLGSERSREALEGVAMELEDSLYPLLREVSRLIGMASHTHGVVQGFFVNVADACRSRFMASHKKYLGT